MSHGIFNVTSLGPYNDVKWTALVSSSISSSLETMKSVAFAVVVFALSSFAPALADIYFLSDKIIGPDFYTAFEWEAIKDPTNGRVFVDLS